MHLFFKDQTYSKLKTIVALFVYIFCLTYTQSHSCAFGEELKLPDIPPRPSMKELLKSLSTDFDNQENSAKIKTLTSNQKDNKLKPKLKAFRDIYTKENKYDIASEKLLNISSNKLFSLLLDTIKTFNLSLTAFDTVSNEIVVTDRSKNKIIIHITSVEENKSKINIIGYSSILYHGKQNLEYNVKRLSGVLSKYEKS